MNGGKDNTTDPSAVNPSAVSGPTSAGTIPLMAGANGNGTNSTVGANPTSPTLLNKKRKKEGLKPIITTEGTAPG